MLEHLPALTHMGEVGQQSDSVSDRSCHHAARTGCTLHFGNSKKHAHSPIPRAADGFAMVKEKPQNIRIFFLPEKRGWGGNVLGKNHSKCNKRPDYAEEL